MPDVQHPTSKPDRHGETFSHPAYGFIRANRVQGSCKALYDSDFVHHQYVSVEIGHSELHRSLNHDHHFDAAPIVRVVMSEAQWAAFVSSMGHMSVPCTIERKGFEGVPELPMPGARADQFRDELKAKLEKVVGRLKDAAANAKTKAHQREIEGALQELTANLDFIVRSFDKHAEGTVEKAKAEIHGILNQTLLRAGLEHLQGGLAPFALEATPTAAIEDHSQEAE